MPLAGQGGPPVRAPVQQGLRPFPSTREKESSTNWRGQRAVIWGCRALSKKQVLISLNFYRSSRLAALTYLPQLKPFKEFVYFLQAPHYKVFLVFSHFCTGHKQCWHCFGTRCPNSVKKHEGCNFPSALNYENHENKISAI